jgi:hypothetical protein
MLHFHEIRGKPWVRRAAPLRGRWVRGRETSRKSSVSRGYPAFGGDPRVNTLFGGNEAARSTAPTTDITFPRNNNHHARLAI